MKPDFIGIGAFRSGTSSLATALRQHPDVALWKYKECYYWNKRYKKQGIDWYINQFSQHKISGEITPSYLVHDRVPERIKAHFPDVKFLLLLRDPVQATISAYWMRHNWRKVRIPLDKVVEQMAAGERPAWVNRYNYPELLQRWFCLFEREQFWIVRSESLWKNHKPHLDKLWDFLGIKRIEVEQYPQAAHIRRKQKASKRTIEMLESIFKPINESLPSLLGTEFVW